MQCASLVLLSLLFYACSNNSSAPAVPQDSLVQDGTIVADTSVLKGETFRTGPQGIYSALLKCTGCPSIKQTIAFLPGASYRMEEQKSDASTIKKALGSWSSTKDTIFIYRNNAVKSRYLWKGDTLYYLHEDGATTVMEKQMAATDNKVWQKKGAEGSEFFGVGNEPFWNIEIDEEKSILFHLADWEKPMVFEPVSPVVTRLGLEYTTGKDAELLNIAISHQFCSDGMSDFIYNHKVTVVYRGETYTGCGILFDR